VRRPNADPARDVIIVPGTRGSIYDPSAEPLEGSYPNRIVGKIVEKEG